MRHLGYAALTYPVTVTRGLTTEVDIGLSPDPVELEPLVADAPGVRLANCDLQGHGCRLYSTRASTGFSDEGCQLNVYLDGNLVVRGSEERWSRAAGDGPFSNRPPPEPLNNLVLPVEIVGLEVYVGAAGLPAEFSGSNSRCGAVVIWTK
ncbi:hypothetical protein [Candidatus Palauibacter sp.]|uniref:hypothetical protein n=1 Tax=Candidatus Palauibacter sp. TaxID=3101350 RepID=UPI003B5171AC